MFKELKRLIALKFINFGLLIYRMNKDEKLDDNDREILEKLLSYKEKLTKET